MDNELVWLCWSMINVEENYATEFYYLSLMWRYDHLKVQLCYIDQHNQINSLSISKCRRRYILTNPWRKTKMLSSSGQIFFSFILCLWHADFWKADEKTILVIYRFAYSPFAVYFICTMIWKLSRRLNSDGTLFPLLKKSSHGQKYFEHFWVHK